VSEEREREMREGGGEREGERCGRWDERASKRERERE
jgi:hypothetical protein